MQWIRSMHLRSECCVFQVPAGAGQLTLEIAVPVDSILATDTSI